MTNAPIETPVLMLRTTVAVVLVVVGTLVAGAQAPSERSFDAEAPGAPPDGFTFAATRQDAPGAWTVRRIGTSGMLVHAADPSQRGYALALSPHDPQRDVIVSARLRLEGGTRAGGVVWRYQDPTNFYAAVLDLTRGTLLMYLFRNGNRITIESKDDLELDPAGWHTLRVVHERASVYVALGGIRVFEERDGRLEQTLGPGRTGLITTGDSEIWFDDLRVEPGRSRRQ